MSTLQSVIAQYIQARRASRYSEHTIRDYQNAFRLFTAFVGEDCVFEEITSRTITAFMASEHVQSVTKKTALNYHTALSSLWHWAVENEYVTENIVRKVKPPVPEQREIIPLTRAEITRLLNACATGSSPARDRAVILVLLNTGIRASEIGSLRVRDLTLPERRLLVMGKGRKKFSGSPRSCALNPGRRGWLAETKTRLGGLQNGTPQILIIRIPFQK